MTWSGPYINESECYRLSNNCSGWGSCIQGQAWSWGTGIESWECRCPEYFLSESDCNQNITFFTQAGPWGQVYWTVNLLICALFWALISGELYQRLKRREWEGSNKQIILATFVLIWIVGAIRTIWWSYFAYQALNHDALLTLGYAPTSHVRPLSALLLVGIVLLVIAEMLVYWIWFDLALSIAQLSNQPTDLYRFGRGLLISGFFVVGIVVITILSCYMTLPQAKSTIEGVSAVVFGVTCVIWDIFIILLVLKTYKAWENSEKGRKNQFRNRGLIFGSVMLFLIVIVLFTAAFRGVRRTTVNYFGLMSAFRVGEHVVSFCSIIVLHKFYCGVPKPLRKYLCCLCGWNAEMERKGDDYYSFRDETPS